MVTLFITTLCLFIFRAYFLNQHVRDKLQKSLFDYSVISKFQTV